MCVGNDDDVRAVALGERGIVSGLAPGAILVDHTTASAEVAREVAEACAAAGIGFVDAPGVGRAGRGGERVLTMMCGCDDEAVFQAARDGDRRLRAGVRADGPRSAPDS